MNKDEQIKALAELDGWNLGPPLVNPQGVIVNQHYNENWRLPPYLTSRDAIIPLIEKQIKDWKEFTYVLNEQVMKLKCRPLDMKHCTISRNAL